MKTYYSTFLSGLSEPVSSALANELTDVKIKELYDGLIIYESDSKPTKMKNLPFFTNSFNLIYKFDSKGDQPLEGTIRRILKSGSLNSKVYLQSEHNRSFRIVTSHENQLVSIDSKLLQALEHKIKDELNLILNRRQADYEFWLLSRSEGFTLFSLRISRQLQKDKEREKGELRPQLSYLLCWLSEPKESEIFMDPFSGSGSIPLTRIEFSRKGLIIASDENEDKVQELKEKVKNLKLKDRIIVRKMNATDINKYQDETIHKIVTDPPWGIFEEMENPLEFYNQVMKELVRILKPEGILIILVANQPALNQFFAKYTHGIDLIKSYSVLVSGKKAIIYKMRKH